MPPLADLQKGFASALLDAEVALPAGLTGPAGASSLKRFNVYRNNVVVSLVEALKAAYPATLRLVGEDFFCAMAQVFASAHPPQSPLMIDYGAGFADFIATFAPAATLPYLADVARIERAWLEAYHAAEAQSLAARDIATITGEMAADLVFQLHPSLRVVHSLYPALTIWRLNVAAEPSAECVLDDGAETALIVRPEADVEVRFLPPGGASFLQALGEGCSLTEAAARVLEIEEFDLALNLKGLLEAGAFTTFTISEK
jgi:hypothetical protein